MKAFIKQEIFIGIMQRIPLREYKDLKFERTTIGQIGEAISDALVTFSNTLPHANLLSIGHNSLDIDWCLPVLRLYSMQPQMEELQMEQSCAIIEHPQLCWGLGH